MSIDGKKRLYVVLVSALALYFISEYVLRRYAIQNIDARKVDLNQVLSKLPSTISDPVSYKIEIGHLIDQLAAAKTDSERALAMCGLAQAKHEIDQKERLFSDVLSDYPNLPQSSQAYLYFLENKETAKPIAVKTFHAYLARQDQLDGFRIWVEGYNCLNRKRWSKSDLAGYLTPLLNIRPEYRDYYRLYEYLSNFAAMDGKREISTKAETLKKEALNKPTIEKTLRERDAALMGAGTTLPVKQKK